MVKMGIEVDWFKEQIAAFFKAEDKLFDSKMLVVALSWWLYDHLPEPLGSQQVSEE